jgi:putative ABC transport system permease protein
VLKTGLINSLDSSWPFSIDEHPPVADEQRPLASSNQVNPNYFAAMGIPLRAGRSFTDRDTNSAPPVILIDETLANRYFPGENPVGKHLRLENTSREIVGVVGATRYGNIGEDPFPHMYLSYQQENWRSMSIVVRTGSANPTSLIPAIRRELAAIDKEQPIHSFKPLEQSVADWIAPQRFSTVLLAYFAALAAVLAAIGIYGVVSYTVTQRTQEIGVRIALGARTSEVLKLVIGKGMKLALAGVMIGLFAAFLLMRLMKSLLFGVSTADPATFVTISLFLTAVALVACYIPARRASRVDPMEALRYE